MTKRSPILVLLLATVGAAGAWLTAESGRVAASPTPAVAPRVDGNRSAQEMAAEWKEVERLLSEQKLRQALESVRAIGARASEPEEWRTLVRAQVTEARILTALGGFERAVQFLRGAARPDSALASLVLDLYYAHGLESYLRAYSWEIRQRERIATIDEAPLTSWTDEQIVGEVHRALAGVWSERRHWGAEPLGEVSEYLRQNNYPPRIRGTLRDAVSYLWVELLADSSLWRPEQSSRLYTLDLERLIAERGPDPATASDPEAHPLLRVAAVLADLESWHGAAGRPEAAFEARRERLARMRAAFERSEDRRRIETALAGALEELGRRYAWWAMGVAELAEWTRERDDADSLIEARELALQGRSAHPDSIGGRRCRHLVAAIEAPAYSLSAMAADAAEKRSIQVLHRNLGALYFRAYALDLDARLARSDDYRLLGDGAEAERIVASRRPDASWRVELPPTPDYRSHRTYVTPPALAPGLHLVVASADREFRQRANEIEAVEMIVGDLVLLSRSAGDRLEVTVRTGSSGRAVPDARVELYRFDYRNGHRLAHSQASDVEGIARFRLPGRESYFILARKDGSVALDPAYRSPARREPPRQRHSALVYTDRSIYRPEQEVFWKAVAYLDDGQGRPRIVPDTGIRVALVDTAGEEVAAVEARTNSFGSASGSFRIPAGRLLGAWTVQTSLGGAASVRVEEYKRPTFEVTVAEPSGPLRLNRRAELAGEARYYFGLPLASGSVSWRVVREPRYPRWWFQPPPPRPETVAAGESALTPDGGFRLSFTPEADEREAGSGISYSFRLVVDVTDEGGETRSATRVFRLGFVTVEVRLDAPSAFFLVGRPIRFDAVRSDLDGTPRAGGGEWSLLRLEQPPRTLLPADEPLADAGASEDPYATPGDRLAPRWRRDYSPQRSLQAWQEGEPVASGEVHHGEDGVAELAIPPLPPGAYRLRFATRDEFGSEAATAEELLVVGAESADLRLPALALAEASSVAVGETARLLLHSGLPDQEMVLELFRAGERTERRRLLAAGGPHLVEIPVGERHRGGFGYTLTVLRDHQVMVLSGSVFVPWDDRKLSVEFATFRDRLRPGEHERWTIRLRSADEETLTAGSAELLAYMYDRSLDLFAAHEPPDPLGLYPVTTAARTPDASLGTAPRLRLPAEGFVQLPAYPALAGDVLEYLAAYGIGGPGRRFRLGGVVPMAARPMSVERTAEGEAEAALAQTEAAMDEPAEPQPEAPVELRTDFSETAFWKPHLVVGEDGAVDFEFTVPDSVTEWNVWMHSLTRDLRAGSATRQTRTVKELMVRPYLPRFLREGDRLQVAVLINNAAERELSGTLDFDLLSADGETSRNADFGLELAAARGRAFTVAPGGSAELFFPLSVPPGPGSVIVRAVARSGELSDGEQRPLPVLPGRFHLAQSRFAALTDADRRELRFDELAAGDDPTRIDERLVVTLDAQLFYGVLRALPYLATFPYECTEQLLNRFLSTGIVSTLYDDYPAVAEMAERFSGRETPFEAWGGDDPNRRMALEETPWLIASRGGEAPGAELVDVLDRRIARATRDASLARLLDAQTSSGGFPWWPGGPPSPYMTLYLLQGFSRALEFDVEVPRAPIARAWGYVHRHYLDVLVRESIGKDCCWEMVTLLNYVLSSYPDESWTGGVFDAAERARMLEFSFRHWREHSPLIKGQLALTLVRAGRREDARLVFDSVMDSARTTRDEGTFWAPEERAWLWYNDTIETHAFALRTLIELDPDDRRRHGLVHWLFLNKKLNQWKSTRATAEVLYSLVHYLEREGTLAAREQVTVSVGPEQRRFTFEPGRYGPVEPHGARLTGDAPGAEGRPNQLVIAGDRIEPSMAEIVVEKSTPGLAFASATWQFSTERLPPEASGDFFAVRRRFFRRVHDGREWVLEPLSEGDAVAVGDQVEVRLTVSSKHAAEYVHLRDPRGAGFEPESQTSRFRWNLGVGWYEEIRDSGANFFFEWLPAGEVELRHRLRAATAGTFRVAPATLQSMYAPEFNAYSAGASARVEPQP